MSDATPESRSIERFEVSVPENVLGDLRERLHRTRWTDAVVGAGWDYGADLDYIHELCAYWADRFDWRAEEAGLNEVPQFCTEIERLIIHFVHVRSDSPGAIPLLLLHGWPSCFIQMLKILPRLADFHVVVPDLPGFGFSGRPTQSGMGVGEVADVLLDLMDRLGYERYAIRASDLGAGIAPLMAMRRPGAVVGLHLSGSDPSADYDHLPDDLAPVEQQMVDDARTFQRNEFAYARLHATKPQTPAIALNDSPAGMAAWIVEKFRAWSDCGGDVEQRFSKDELLTFLTVYWATETIGSSMRLYFESAHHPPMWGELRAPVAMAMLPADMFPTPREWVERRGPVARWVELPRGGHFGEWEEPVLIADDIRAFLAELREP
ncbi:epoxide hydrolase family protein [Agromyces humatus]